MGEEGEPEHWPDAPTATGDSHRIRLEALSEGGGTAVSGYTLIVLKGRTISSHSHSMQHLSVLVIH